MVKNEDVINEIESSAEKEIKKTPVDFISTGCINLNLAASQKSRDGGWARGRINNVVADGGNGKTILCLEMCANAYYDLSMEATENFPEIKKLIIVYNNVEGVMDFPIEEMYGQEFCNNIEWIQINIAQKWGRDVQRRISDLKKGECLIYVVDSLDALISQEEKDRIDKSLKTDKDQEGSYKTEKAKYFSMSFFNDLCDRMQGKDVTLFIVNQVRENLNAGTFGKKLYRTGGKALDFYTHQVAWLYQIEKLKKTKNNQERVNGVRIRAKYERNKTAKPYREADFIILFDYGVDNVGSMVAHQFGPKVKKIIWGEEEFKREEFINFIEENEDEYNKLVDLIEKDWLEIEDAIKPNRKKRFEK